MTASMLDHALEYAGRGWPVFPLAGPKNGPIIPSRHPVGDPLRGKCQGACGDDGHGFHDATTDPERIRQWWTRWPRANIGAATGVVFDVLDVDHQDYAEGVADLPDAVTEGGPVARSGGGKWHLYFLPSGRRRSIRFSQHCDYLGIGGYVVLPPATHRSGGTYSWFTPDPLPFTPAPAALLEAVDTRCGRELQNRSSAGMQPLPIVLDRPRRARGRGWSVDPIIDVMKAATSGERNKVLFWCAARIGNAVHDREITSTAAGGHLDTLHAAAAETGLSAHEIARTIESGYPKGCSGERPTQRAVGGAA